MFTTHQSNDVFKGHVLICKRYVASSIRLRFFILPQFENILTVAELMYRRNTSGATTTLNIECVRTSLIVAANAVHRSIGSLRLPVV